MSQFNSAGIGATGISLLVGAPIDSAGDLGDLAESSTARDGDRLQELVLDLVIVGGHFRALLGSHLEDSLGLVQNLDDLLSFENRQRQRLFAVDILAGPHRFDGDLRVPVIGGDNGHNLHIFPVEQLAIVFEHFGVARESFFRLNLFDLVATFFFVLGVNITDGNTV